MKSFDQPWQPNLDWSAPAGKVLDQLVSALPPDRNWEIIVFGSSPLQDEESAGNPKFNTELLWRELFGKEIEVGTTIIGPALAELRRGYSGSEGSLKTVLAKTKPSP